MEDIIDVNPSVNLKKGEEYPFIDIDKVSPSLRTVTNEETKIYDGQGSKFCPGDTVFSRITPCLENRKIAQVSTNKPGFGSTEFYVFRAKKDLADPDYIYYLTSSNVVVLPAINSMSGASGRQRADKRFIQRLKIKVPSVSEQRKIACILSAYDNLIEINKKRIKVLEQIAENLYKEWFVRFRFPGYETVELIDLMPKDWKLCKLGDFLLFGSGKAKPNEGTIYPVYGGNGITDWCDQYNYENIVIIGRVGAYSGSVYYESGKCWISDNGLFAKRLKSDPISIYYDFYLLSSLNLNKFQGGTGQPLITQGMLSKVKIYLPPDELIRKFGLVIKPLFENIKILNTEIENLIKQRNLLLPRLMSGKMGV